jgi:hypothetical protein
MNTLLAISVGILLGLVIDFFANRRTTKQLAIAACLMLALTIYEVRIFGKTYQVSYDGKSKLIHVVIFSTD